MTRYRLSVVLVAALTLVGPAGLSRAADSKDKLPKAKTGDPAVVTPKDSPAPAPKKKDHFVDKNNDGRNDRSQPKVIRPEENPPPPTVKPKEVAPPPAQPPAAKAPPGH